MGANRMRILTIAEVAARLGKSKRSIYRLIAAGVSIEDVAGLLGNTTTVALRAYVDITAESERLERAAGRG